jgi:hypothetical protein
LKKNNYNIFIAAEIFAKFEKEFPSDEELYARGQKEKQFLEDR